MKGSTGKVLSLLAIVMLLASCSFSMDTVKYANGTDKIVQSASCDVTLDEPVIPAEAKVIKIKEVVMFPFDSAELKPSELVKIKAVADIMNANPDIDVMVDSYASSEGPEDYNLDLSNQRGISVMSELVRLGVSSERIIVTGRGETGKFGSILKLNRRALILDLQ